ncbi:MAG TPA: hypothetical protein VEK79_25455 [Thermoanaerobaculia bacterium]|nr:hypothetical protein [Thermoanaerobaculia bacterium]
MIVALLLAILIAPLAAAHTGDERPVGDVIIGPAPYSNGPTSVASDGDGFFVVWRDTRDGDAILAKRIAHDGTLIQSGIEIVRSAPLASTSEPKVVWTGFSYAVFWKSSTYSEGSPEWSIWVARYNRDGILVDGRHIVVERTRELHSVAFNGTHFLLSYLDPFGLRPRAWLLDVDAKPLKHLLLADVEVFPGSGMASTAKGSEFLVAWEDWDPEVWDVVHAIRIDGSGDVQGSVRRIGEGRYPKLASDGAKYLLLSKHRYENEPWVSRIVSGDLSQSSAPRIVPNTTAYNAPTVLWHRDRYLLMNRDLLMLDREGNAISDVAALLNDPAGQPISPSAAANASSRLMVTWTSCCFGTDTAAIARLFDGHPPVASTPNVLLSASANRQIDPDIAHSRSGELVAWRERDGVYATRVDGFGVSVDGRGIELSRDRITGPPRVAFNGTDYVVTWREQNSVEVRFISPSTGLRSERIHIDAAGFDAGVGLAVAADAAYVAWTAERVWLLRIDRQTRAADGVALPISPEGAGVTDATVASNGSQLLVAWHEVTESYGYPYGWSSDIVGRTWAARVTANMTLLDAAPMHLGDNGEAYPHAIGIASNGSDWLLTWLGSAYDHETHSSAQKIVARRVLQNGTIEGNKPVAIAAGVASSLLWTGTDYAIARKDNQARLHLGHIASNGALAIQRDREITATESSQERVGLTLIASRPAIVYARMSRAPEHGNVERVFLRLLPGAPKRRAVR